MEHVGLWFLALLIPLYIITPLLYKILSMKHRYLHLSVLLVLVMFLSVYHFEDSHVTNTIQSCLSRVPCYLIGICIGSDVRESKKTSIFILVPIILYIVLQSFDCLRMVYKGWIWALLISAIFTQFFSWVNRYCLKLIDILNFIGKYTLELYIGLDIAKNILVLFMDLSTTYWVLSIAGSIGCAVLYNVLQMIIRYLKITKWN